MDLRRTLISRLALAFIGLLLLFAVVWLQDLRDDAVAEQQATSVRGRWCYERWLQALRMLSRGVPWTAGGR